MQLLWHCLVDLSFGYLTLIATARIGQEALVCVSALSRSLHKPRWTE